ncbi:MAG: hypothetical protein P8Y06_01945, partial [Patescibacteria group bacterium]
MALPKGVKMADSPNKLVPPSKKTVNFLYRGLVVFYPKSVFATKEERKKATLEFRPETGWAEFVQLLWNVTGTEDTDEAAKIVLEWKNLLSKGGSLEATIPENLDGLLSSLDDNATGNKRLSAYDAQALLKKSLLESQRGAERKFTKPTEEIISTAPAISKAAGPLSVFAGKILTAPLRWAVYFSGEAVYSSSAEGEGPGVATARYMLTHGINSSSIYSLRTRAQSL